MSQDVSVRVLLEPSIEADFVYPFSDGMAAVRVIDTEEGDFRLGYVNRYGQFVIPFRAYPPTPHWQTPAFSHGLVSVYSHVDEAVGFFDATGAAVIPFMYDRPLGSSLEFVYGLAAVSLQGLWGFIDVNGGIVIPYEFERAGNFSEGRAPVMQNGRWGFVNTDGEFVIPFVLDHYSGETEGDLFVNPGFSEALAPILLGGAEGYRWGFLNLTGNRIPSDLYVYVEGFTEGRALVMQEDGDNQLFGFISRDGVEVIPLTYSYAYSFSGGLAAVRQGGQWGFIDHYGSVQVPIRYDSARGFNDGFAAVMQGDLDTGRWGFIDRWDNQVVPLIYYEVRDFSDGLAAVRTGDGANARWGFVDRNGEVVVPIQYLEVHSFSEGLAWVRGTGGWGIIEIAEQDDDSPPSGAFESRYIHQDTPDYQRFVPAQGAIESVYDAITADEVIFRAMRNLTPQQRGSGDAINIATLFIENAIRRGTTQSVPEDGSINAGVLLASAHVGQNIWQDALTTVANENVNLMRPLALNINFTSQARDRIAVAFPNDVSGIAFDNLTIEAGFASVTLGRGDIPRESEIVFQRGPVVHSGVVMEISQLDAQGAEDSGPRDDGAGIGGFFSGIRNSINLEYLVEDGFTPRNILDSPLHYLQRYWAVAAIILLIILWIVLARLGHKFRIWVVPTFTILALLANGWTLGVLNLGDRGIVSLPSGYFHTVTVTMSPGMQATLSIPLNGANPDLLVLYNEQGEAMHSHHNPVTDSIDARITISGTYTLLAHNTGFADIDELSPQARQAITRLAAMGIMDGTEGNFRPTSAITRGEFASALVMALSILDTSAPNHFPDNDPDDPYFHAITTAANNSLMNGFEDGNFRGSWAITKNDLVFALARALTMQMQYHMPENLEPILTIYQDTDKLPIWAQPSIALTTATNVLLYREDGLFAPDSVMARQDAAIIIYRLLGRIW